MAASHDQPKYKNPIVFFNKKDPNPEKREGIYFQDKEINNKDKFAILKTTDNGAYIRGNMLYYKLNNVEIYTELNNVIFVDLHSMTLTIKQYDQVISEISPEDPEVRQYIILMYVYGDNDEQICRWESMNGRSNIYEYIKQYIDIYDFDPDKSVVITDNVAFKDALSVTAFVKYLQNGNLVEEDDFDIDQYRYSEVDSEDD